MRYLLHAGNALCYKAFQDGDAGVQRSVLKDPIPGDFPDRIRRLRVKHGLTQIRLAELMGVSFSTVNRWENGQSRPSPLAWQQIIRAERLGVAIFDEDYKEEHEVAEPAKEYEAGVDTPPPIDFLGNPVAVWAISEAERLTYGFIFNPAFATEVSLIDPLPHQRLAVYENMLNQTWLRYLLADDAGAGKTIMAGLYIREMLARRLLRPAPRRRLPAGSRPDERCRRRARRCAGSSASRGSSRAGSRGRSAAPACRSRKLCPARQQARTPP